MRRSCSRWLLLASTAALGLLPLRAAEAQVVANGAATGSANGVPAGLPVGIAPVQRPPSLAFSMRADAGAIIRGMPADDDLDGVPDFAVLQGTATISLGSETRIGGFYTEIGFAGGQILGGDEAFSAGLNAMYQKPWRWFRLGGGFGGAYHALGRGIGEGFDHTGELLLRVQMEIDPLMNRVWNPYFGLTGQVGLLIGEMRLGATYAGGAALGFRFSDW